MTPLRLRLSPSTHTLESLESVHKHAAEAALATPWLGITALSSKRARAPHKLSSGLRKIKCRSPRKKRYRRAVGVNNLKQTFWCHPTAWRAGGRIRSLTCGCRRDVQHKHLDLISDQEMISIRQGSSKALSET